MWAYFEEMGSCVSVHKDPGSAMKLRFSIGSKNEKLLIPSPVKEKPVTVNVGDATVAVRSQFSPARFPNGGNINLNWFNFVFQLSFPCCFLCIDFHFIKWKFHFFFSHVESWDSLACNWTFVLNSKGPSLSLSHGCICCDLGCWHNYVLEAGNFFFAGHQSCDLGCWYMLFVFCPVIKLNYIFLFYFIFILTDISLLLAPHFPAYVFHSQPSKIYVWTNSKITYFILFYVWTNSKIYFFFFWIYAAPDFSDLFLW